MVSVNEFSVSKMANIVAYWRISLPSDLVITSLISFVMHFILCTSTISCILTWHTEGDALIYLHALATATSLHSHMLPAIPNRTKLRYVGPYLC